MYKVLLHAHGGLVSTPSSCSFLSHIKCHSQGLCYVRHLYPFHHELMAIHRVPRRSSIYTVNQCVEYMLCMQKVQVFNSWHHQAGLQDKSEVLESNFQAA